MVWFWRIWGEVDGLWFEGKEWCHLFVFRHCASVTCVVQGLYFPRLLVCVAGSKLRWRLCSVVGDVTIPPGRKVRRPSLIFYPDAAPTGLAPLKLTTIPGPKAGAFLSFTHPGTSLFALALITSQTRGNPTWTGRASFTPVIANRC